MNRAGAALPALLQFPVEGGSEWERRAKSGVGGPELGVTQSGVGADGSESAPQEGRDHRDNRGLPPAADCPPSADQALASRWAGRA